MGKIRVADLARKMGIPEQDLLFKLKSIGVRVEEENAQIDTSVIQAILEGKRMPQPREVILRDEESKATAPVARRRPPSRRLPGSPMRPQRRRVIIQKVEPKIKTIPVTAAPPVPDEAVARTAAPEAPAAASPEAIAGTPAPAQPGTAQGTAAPAAPIEVRTPPAGKKVTPARVPPKAPTRISRGQRRAKRRRETVGANVLSFKQEAPETVITIAEGMTVREFADKLGVKAKDLIKLLVGRGMMATINHVLDIELAQEIALGLDLEARVVSFEEEVQLQQEHDLDEGDHEGEASRAPVVTIMGHVDHGKTTLLDGIRSSKITESEFGGITQHIGAYQVEINGKKLVFLDTPGHEAFTMMRARGAKVTDMVILVVAADDGVMPQTIEAINHAQAAGAPIIVAINKMDRVEANPDRVKKELSDQGLTVEDWGGDVVAMPISALKMEGVKELLEMVLLNAELLELKANPELPGQGVVLEARKEAGRGIIATVLVQNGSLRPGDVFVAGATWGRVRSMTDDLGNRLTEAEPATPVEVTGFGDVPDAGDLFQIVDNESKARSIAEFRRNEQRSRELAPSVGKVSLEQIFDRINEGELKELPIVLKGDVQGSVEVLKDTLAKLGTEKVKVEVIHSGVGAITTNDVILASASGAIVVGFNVRPERNAADLSDKEEVDIRLHTVIYELSDELRRAMTGLLEPTLVEEVRGRAQVRETFSVPKLGAVAGCHVLEGSIPRNAEIRLLRDNVVIYSGRIASLRRFKEDVSEVRAGFDCGIRLDKYQDLKPGDTIEAFVQKEVAATL